MWWWLFLLISAALADAASLNISSTSDDLRNSSQLDDLIETEDLEKLQETLDEIIKDYLQHFADAHLQNTKRQKRQTSDEVETYQLADRTGFYRAQAVSFLYSVCYGAATLKVKFIDIMNATYVACISEATDKVSAQIHLGYITFDNWYKLDSWDVENPEDIALLYDQGVLNILVADSRNGRGIPLMRYDISTRERVFNHDIHGTFPTAVAVWKMKLDGAYDMALANSNENTDTDDLTSRILVYNWKDTYFDKYSEIIGYDVKDLEPFHVHGAAYLAVANYRKRSDDFKVDSEVFRYNMDENVWLSHQKIRTHRAMDFEFFTLGKGNGQEFFLAVANYAERSETANSVIYKFVDNMFVPFQCLETYKATSISTISDDRFLLAIANDDVLHLYQYDGWRFVKASLQYTQNLPRGVRHLSFHVLGEEKSVILAIASKTAEPILTEMIFVHENRLGDWYEKSSDWCQKKLQYLEDSNVSGLENLQDVFFIDQKDPITIKGDISFDNGFEAAEIITPQFVDTSEGRVYDNSVLLKLNALDERLKKAAERIENIKNVFSRALALDGNQTVTATYEFKDVTFQCQTHPCIFHNITTTLLNGENVSDLESNLIFLDKTQHINASLNAANVNAGNVFLHGKVNGMRTQDIVTKSGIHNINGTKIFENKIHVSEIEVKGTIDGVKISPQTILLRSGSQNVTGNLTFSHLNTEWLEITGLLNGHDLKEFYRNVVLTEGNYIITDQKTFADLSVDNLQMALGSKINDVDIVDLHDNTLWKDGDQIIRAPMTFSSVSLKKDLVVNDVNGIQIPGPRILLVDANDTIMAPQTFHQTTSISNLFVENSINGIGVNKVTGELDILLSKGHQVVTGQKTFDTIVLEGDSFVGGTVDGVDLSEFFAITARGDKPFDSQRTWTFQNLVVNGPLRIGGNVSGRNLKDLYDRAVKLNDTNLPNFTFTDFVHINNLISNDINGIDVSNDLVQVHKKQTIAGEKRFQNIILTEDSVVLGTVNNINLSFLNDTLLRIGNQIIRSKKIFQGDVSFNKLSVYGSINKVSFEDIVTLQGDEIINGTKTFENLVADTIIVKNLEVTGLVNGIDINNMVNDTLTFDGVQTVTGTKNIIGTIQVDGKSNLQTNWLNGVDINNLWSDAVLVDVPQNISGHKTFDASVVFEDLWVRDSIDGVTERDINNWMLQGVDQRVEGNVWFTKDVTANSVFVNGYINNVNITELNETMVKIDEPTYIEGPIIFANKVHSYDDITLTGKVGGLDLSEEAVLKTEEIVITSPKTFDGDIVIDGDLLVEGLIDGVSIKDICENSILLDRAQDLEGLIVYGDVTFEKGGSVTGTLAGVNLTFLDNEVVKSDNKDSVLDGLKVFEALTIDGNLNVQGKFGDIDIKDLAENYMSVSRNQEIKASLNFEELQVNGTMHAVNFFTIDQKINDIDMDELNKTLLRTTGFQLVDTTYTFDDVVFDGDVVVAGTVNGIQIPDGVMKRDRINYIHSPKIFQNNVHILSDLRMDDGKTIQGVNLAEWTTRTVKKEYGSYEVRGNKTFLDLTVGDMTVAGLIDGVKVSETTLLLPYGTQEITGKKIILGDVSFNNGLTVGLVNNVNLTDLAKRAVFRDSNNEISGAKIFKKPLTLHSLESGPINGVDVVDLQNRVNVELDYNELMDRIEELDTAIHEIKLAVYKQPVILQYYELFQSFATTTAYKFLYVPTTDKEYLLLSDFGLMNDSCSRILVHESDGFGEDFRLTQQILKSSLSISMAALNTWNTTVLITANQRPNHLCSNDIIDVMAAYKIKEKNYKTPINVFYLLNGVFTYYDTIMAHSSTDLVAFSDADDSVCFVYLEIVYAKLFCADPHQDFELIYTLRTKGGRKAALTQNDDTTFLAIASISLDLPTPQSVDIYIWKKGQLSGEPVQVIRSTQAESVLFMKRENIYSTEIFLLIAEGTIPQINNVPRLFIYKFDNVNLFHKFQEIKDSGELDWTLLPSGDLIFFILDVRAGQIRYYSYKGSAGFVFTDTITSVGAQTLHVFKRNFTEDKTNHYLALAGLMSSVPSSWNDPTPTKILKSKMLGAQPYY